MDLLFFYKGLILGFSVAAPVGPIGILCINRTLNKGYASGLVTGLGAATADLLYGLIAGFGLSIISNFLIGQKLWMQIIGLIFLFYLGIKTLMKNTAKMEYSKSVKSGWFKDYLTTFLLTITNPVTILFFLAAFAGLGLSVSGKDNFSSIALVSGVFLGSGIWWFILSGLTYKLKNKISPKILRRIDLFSGILILLFGMLILFDLVKEIK